MSHHAIQFKNSSRCTYTTSTSSFFCVFALIFLFVGYIGLSHAEPLAIFEEKQVKHEEIQEDREEAGNCYRCVTLNRVEKNIG